MSSCSCSRLRSPRLVKYDDLESLREQEKKVYGINNHIKPFSPRHWIPKTGVGPRSPVRYRRLP
jgi:hypothetical protein